MIYSDVIDTARDIDEKMFNEGYLQKGEELGGGITHDDLFKFDFTHQTNLNKYWSIRVDFKHCCIAIQLFKTLRI